MTFVKPAPSHIHLPTSSTGLLMDSQSQFDESARTTFFIEYGSDINNSSETSLQGSTAPLSQIIQGSPVPTFVIDAQHRVTHWNRACEAIFNVSAATMVGTTNQWRAFYADCRPVLADLIVDGVDDDGIARHYDGKFRRSGLIEGAYEAEDFFPHFGRGGRWLYFTAAPLRDGGGRIIGAIETLQDITERKFAEAALRLRERAVESSNNGIMISDLSSPDNAIVYVNPAFERITGYSLDEAVGRNARFLVGDDQDQFELEKIRAALRQRRSAGAVLRNYRKDGTLFWNELYVAPVPDDLGRVSHYVGIITDITERKRYEQQLEHQANHDALTGLANRNLLMDRLEQSLVYAQRFDRMVAVLFVDLDNFKAINDTLGHGAGDALVQQVARRLPGCIRDVDTLSRLGGDEFVVVLYGPDSEEMVTEVMRRILEAVAKPYTIDDSQLFVTCSIGASLYPRDGRDPATLLKNADVAMYRAKEQERNAFQYFTSAMDVGVSERFSLERDLRFALERNELSLYYQPQLDLRTGRIVGAEALLRWRHPQLGLVSPAKFIPIAEQSGLIVPIGRWVIDTACAQGKRWLEAGWEAVRVSVNLSARQFRQPDLDKEIGKILRDHDLDPLCLELEITESMVMHDPVEATATLHELKGLGLRLSMDDFGTGYSSLSYLKSFPIDILKIDRSFVQDITTDASGAAIVRAIISLAHSLKLKVVAEGVETIEQLDFLREHDCDEMQGFYFSPAVPAEDFFRLLLPAAADGERPVTD